MNANALYTFEKSGSLHAWEPDHPHIFGVNATLELTGKQYQIRPKPNLTLISILWIGPHSGTEEDDRRYVEFVDAQNKQNKAIFYILGEVND